MANKVPESKKLALFKPSPEAREMAQSAKEAIEQVLKLEIHERLEKVLLYHLIWQVTVADGKHNTRYRSEGAIDTNKRQEGLHHEHIYPIKWLITQLMKRRSSPADILKNAVACMVTKSEHTRLNAKFVGSATVGWDRYVKAGVKVYDMSSNPPQFVSL